ncbi:hypothetical protein T484DRAFT_1799495 [Baffinella frigidus]|nr:hypothetical protein T484DRAFT_1799495 [Cryptophyta sp. CCMP2293]
MAGAQGCKPFPTLFWLCHPGINAQVSELEFMGKIEAFKNRLQADAGEMGEMEAAHNRYAVDRYALLTAEDVTAVEKEGWAERLSTVIGL